jgi:phosphoglucomutase
MKICLDPLYGTARGYLDKLLSDMGVEVYSVHDWRDPYFGGYSPEPGPKQLESLVDLVKEKNADLGLATDGDADRFGVVDRDGTFIEANYVLAVLLDHLLATREWKGAVVRSIATTHFLDAIAEAQNYEVIETPVGFKYIAQVMETGPIIIGGEESAGMTVHNYIPEKDGILACLLVAEMVATRKRSVSEILEDLYETHGKFVTARKNLKLTDEIKEKLMKTLKENTPEIIGNQKVIEVSLKEGIKTILSDGSWVMFRPSGTEPIVRCYVEGKSQEQVETLLADCQAIVDTL